MLTVDSILDFFLGTPRIQRRFLSIASTFYPKGMDRWEPVQLDNATTCYLLQNDPYRRLVFERMLVLTQRCNALWRKLKSITISNDRRQDMHRLRDFFEPGDGLVHIAQKPSGGYDVRAYAQENWIFIELPTFSSVEDGSDGVNTSESKRRETLWSILLHEIAHVAGKWEHGIAHDQTIAWLQNVDAKTI